MYNCTTVYNMKVDGEKQIVYSFENPNFIVEATAAEDRRETSIQALQSVVESPDCLETDTKGQVLFENKSLLFDHHISNVSKANFSAYPSKVNFSAHSSRVNVRKSKYKSVASSHNQEQQTTGL